MTTKAAQKRFDAIRAITDYALDCNNRHQVAEGVTVGKLVKKVRDLKALGNARTAGGRWGVALSRWEALLIECDDYEQGSEHWKRWLHVAVLQGSVYAVHAAE